MNGAPDEMPVENRRVHVWMRTQCRENPGCQARIGKDLTIGHVQDLAGVGLVEQAREVGVGNGGGLRRPLQPP